MACVSYYCIFALAVAAGAAGQPTPVSKVIDLLQGLQTKVQGEGKREAASYDKYACFCKSTTTAKSTSVKTLKDKIDVLSADIAENTQAKEDDITELRERKEKQEALSGELEQTKVRCAKEKAEYDATNADLSKAISSLKSAIKAMKDSKPAAAAASLLAIKSSVLGSATSKRAASIQTAMATLKVSVDPNDPAYAFHSDDIIKICESLLQEFQDEKSDVDAEWDKTSKSCDATVKSLEKKMSDNTDAMTALKKEIQSLIAKIAKDREDLVTAEGDLKDDELYLKDLTAQCEARAHDYDQRSEMRDGELTALKSALKILRNDVADAESVNQRALFLQNQTVAKSVADGSQRSNAAAVKNSAAESAPGHNQGTVKAHADVNPPTKTLSFVQESLIKQHSQSFLDRASTDVSLEAKKNRAMSVLQHEARRLGSLTISSLVFRASADPFKKVKGLIQKLIERLLEESKAEATKKGFCDESLGKAENDRDARFEEANDLNREIKGLQAKEDELSEEIKMLTKHIAEEDKTFKETTKDRKTEKAENLDSIKTAKEGLAAVTEALQILKSFYSDAAKAAVFVQASPLDEDTSGPGFEGSYKGQQGGMKSVFALLEVIQSDFDRTIRKTEEAEKQAHRDYVAFMQASKSDTGSMSTKKELDTQDLKSTKTAIETKFADLQAAMDLLDIALKELEELKPTCIDSGMSYKERVQKREDEIKALGKALCILDTDNVESSCS